MEKVAAERVNLGHNAQGERDCRFGLMRTPRLPHGSSASVAGPLHQEDSSTSQPDFRVAELLFCPFQILDEVEKRRGISPALVQPLMRSVMEAPFPALGKTIVVKNFLPGSGTEVRRQSPLLSQGHSPDSDRVPVIPRAGFSGLSDSVVASCSLSRPRSSVCERVINSTRSPVHPLVAG